MIDTKTLYFYYVDDFISLNSYPELNGKEIMTLSKLLSLNEITSESLRELDLENKIIDISILQTYTSPQRIFETFEPLVNLEKIIFIAEEKCRSLFEIELRFCFSNFSHLPSSVKKIRKPENVKKIIDLNPLELTAFKNKFSDSLYGHAKFKDTFHKHIDTFRIFNKLGEHKVLSLFLLGESGVGKTEVARAIHKSLGGVKAVAKVNFGNYSDHTSLNSLIGSSRGYIGSDDGEIFKRVRDSDTGVILIDEFEKGNPTVYNFFLSALETGIMTNSQGDDINIDGFIIIFTSNISKEDFKQKISPELRSRFDYKCRFSLLHDSDKEKYTNFRLNNIINNFESEFSYKLPLHVRYELLLCLSFGKFSNMRDLNKEIKSRFIDYLETLNDFEYN